MSINTQLDISLPVIPSEGATQEELRRWRQSLLDTFVALSLAAYKDFASLQFPIGYYILSNSNISPSITLDYGIWTLDKTDGDGVRFWRRTE